MKKFLLFSFLVVFVCSFAKADEYEYLVFTTTDGDIALLSQGVTITFDEANLIAANAQETQTIPLSTLKKFCFSHDTTGINEIFSSLGDGPVDVYTAAGVYVGRFSYTPGEAFPLLTKGVYVLKAQGERVSKKLIVR